MTALAAPLADLPHVADIRQAGMILAIELTKDGKRDTPFDGASRVGLHAYRKAIELGVVLRPLGDILYWMPPYCVDDEQLMLLADTTRAAILHATKDAA
jgi:adenosylmethionine-8-amino-7-oxononanoate aminotransferase